MSIHSLQGPWANKLLVKGYTQDRYDEHLRHFETVYAVTEEGEVYTTGERPFNNSFDPPRQKWARITELPEGAEFVGNYRRPAFERR